MTVRALRSRWSSWQERLRSSLWVVPSAMVAASIAAALGTLALDRSLGWDIASLWWALDVGPEGTRVTLSTLAGSVLTVAGVAFSMTMVVLQLASTQYSPRIIRTFRRDRLIQVVFGAYTGTFVYSLLVLRTISASEEGRDFTAPVSVSVAIVLGVVCMILLITLVHHVARNVQVSTTVRHIAEETRETFQRLYPDELGESAADEGDAARAPERDEPAWSICAGKDGYVDYVDAAAFDEVEGASLVCIRVRVGDFVRSGEVLASVWPEGAGAHEGNADLRAAIVISDERTLLQDPRYGLRLVVDVALRALSPGVNDPATAVHCVDVLGGLVCGLAGRRIPSPWRRAPSGLVVFAPRPSFDEMVGLAFDEILGAATSSLPVQIAVAQALAALRSRCTGPERRRAVEREIERAERVADRSRWDADQRRALDAVLTGARSGEPRRPDGRASLSS